MNREEYIQQLEEQSGYCDCPQLRDLFEKRAKAQELEARCDFDKQNVDLENPLEEDLQKIISYRDEVISLQIAAKEYHLSLGEHVRDGRVVLSLHNFNDSTISRISASERENILDREKNSVLSYHCARCDQQIDIEASE